MGGNQQKLIKELLREATAQGWTHRISGGGHHRLTPPDPGQDIVFFPQSPSDHRSWMNLLKELERKGLDVSRFR